MKGFGAHGPLSSNYPIMRCNRGFDDWEVAPSEMSLKRSGGKEGLRRSGAESVGVFCNASSKKFQKSLCQTENTRGEPHWIQTDFLANPAL